MGVTYVKDRYSNPKSPVSCPTCKRNVKMPVEATHRARPRAKACGDTFNARRSP